MIIANIPHNGETLTVEVLDAFTTGDGRKLALVRALAGEPFPSWTHGGWAYSPTANVRADRLRDVAILAELPQPSQACALAAI